MKSILFYVIYCVFLCNCYAQGDTIRLSNLSKEEKEIFLQFMKDLKGTSSEFKNTTWGKTIYGNPKKVVSFEEYQLLSVSFKKEFDVVLDTTCAQKDHSIPYSRLIQYVSEKKMQRIEVFHYPGSRLIEIYYSEYKNNKRLSYFHYGLLPDGQLLFVLLEREGSCNCFPCSGDTTYAKKILYTYHLLDYVTKDMAEVPNMNPLICENEVAICSKYMAHLQTIFKKL